MIIIVYYYLGVSICQVSVLQCNRTAYHFACCLAGETGSKIRQDLIQAGANIEITDPVYTDTIDFLVITLHVVKDF